LLTWQYLQVGVPIRAIIDTASKSIRFKALRHLPAALNAFDTLLKGFRLIKYIRHAGSEL
jgi:hypothetical protein